MTDLDTGAADAAAEGAVAPSMEETMAKAFDRMETNNGSDRGENGQYTNPDKTAGAGTGDADKNSSDQAATGQADGQSKTATEPPTGWSDEDKAWFKTLPPERQTILAKRESERDTDYTRKTQELSGERKRYEAFNPVLAPIEAAAKQYGMTADIAIKQMFERHLDIQQNGIEGLKRLAGVYGLKLDGIAGGTDTGEVDPEIAALKSQLQTMTNELNGFKNHQSTQTRTALERDMDSVRDEKGSDGKPLRPHFEALYEDMAPIAADLRAKNPSWTVSKIFSEAYDRAVHANPETRAKMAAESQAKAKAEQERVAKEAAAAARKAGGNYTRQTGAHAGGGTAKSKSIEDTMGRVFDEQHAA